jgi:hypothetical protein
MWLPFAKVNTSKWKSYEILEGDISYYIMMNVLNGDVGRHEISIIQRYCYCIEVEDL